MRYKRSICVVRKDEKIHSSKNGHMKETMLDRIGRPRDRYRKMSNYREIGTIDQTNSACTTQAYHVRYRLRPDKMASTYNQVTCRYLGQRMDFMIERRLCCGNNISAKYYYGTIRGINDIDVTRDEDGVFDAQYL